MSYWGWLAVSAATLGLSGGLLYYWPAIIQADTELSGVIAMVNHRPVSEVSALPVRRQYLLVLGIVLAACGIALLAYSLLGITGRLT